MRQDEWYVWVRAHTPEDYLLDLWVNQWRRALEDHRLRTSYTPGMTPKLDAFLGQPTRFVAVQEKFL